MPTLLNVTNPFDGFDGWIEIKPSFWIDSREAIGPYLSIIPRFTSEKELWRENNTQVGIGIHFFPFVLQKYSSQAKRNKIAEHTEDYFKDLKYYKYVRGIRLYTTYVMRDYYDKPSDNTSEDDDIKLGVDYYFDNLFDNLRTSNTNIFSINNFAFSICSNVGYRKTNFIFKDYKALTFDGNVKLGPKYFYGNSLIFPYILAHWSYVPKHDDHWWDNFIRLGVGIRWHPKVDRRSKFLNDLLRRFNFYAEIHQNVSWLCDKPDNDVELTDFRIGVNFLTSVFNTPIERIKSSCQTPGHR